MVAYCTTPNSLSLFPIEGSGVIKAKTRGNFVVTIGPAIRSY
jgi:hypothetical protein